MSELNKAGEQASIIEDSQAGNNQPTTNLYKVNGQEMTPEQVIESYNNLQSEFTKKSQELAGYKNTTITAEPDTTDTDLDETKQILKDMGFTTNEELAELKEFKTKLLTEKETQIKNEEFNNFVGKFNTLTDSQKTILKDLKQVHTDKSYEDILKDTNFIDETLIEKSKTSGSVQGGNIGIPEAKKELTISPDIIKKQGFKTSDELSNIRSQFNL